MKRQSLTLWLAIVLVMVLNCLTLRAVNTIIYNATYTYSASNLTIGTDTLDGVTYTTVSYNGLYNGGDPGMPSLPVDYIRFSVPWNATNFTVNALLQNNIIQTIDYRVYPCQRPWLMNDTTPTIITPPDSAAYFSNAYYPSQNAWVVNEGFLAGENHIVTVAVLPISYKRSGTGSFEKNQLKKSQTVRLTLSYQLKDSLPMYPIARQDSALRREGYALTQSMVANPTNVEPFAPINLALDSLIYVIPPSGNGLNGGIDPPNPPISNDSITNGPEEMGLASYPYLIVTTNELVHSVRRIAALKRQKGYGVKVVTMNEVLSSPFNFGGDRIRLSDNTYHVVDSTDAGKLRQFLKYYYSRYGTYYVFLVGDSIPYKVIPTIENGMCPTDTYFNDLNADWSDTITYKKDFFPEIYSGRLMAKNNQEVHNYTDKLLRYELNPGNGNRQYLKRVFYSEGIDQNHFREVYNLSTNIHSIYPDSSCIYFMESQLNGKFPSGTDIIDTLNVSPCSFISMSNHAGPTGFITYGQRNRGLHNIGNDTIFYYLWAIDSIHQINGNDYYEKDKHTGNGLNCLKNKWYPSVLYSTGCTTMPFDEAPDYPNVSVNLGESFTTGKDYGGPAFLGNTRKGLMNGNSSSLLQIFASELVTKNNYHIGMLEAVSKFKLNNPSPNDSDRTNIYKKVTGHIKMTHNLLGDPEFEIWTDIPTDFSNISISRKNDSITISGINDNSTYVALCSNDGMVSRKMSNSDSVILNQVSPNSTIMIYKHNSIPYIAPLLLQNTILKNSQYVFASDVVAGNSIDIGGGRTGGDVTVKSGVEYKIEASGTVTLQDGFKVEKGATFAVYPSCY